MSLLLLWRTRGIISHRYILSSGCSMPPKLLDRRASISSSSSSSNLKGLQKAPPYSYKKDFRKKDFDEIDYGYRGQSRAVSVKGPDGTSLQFDTKPCMTCGREITPRRKWIKNWNQVKYCSDSCKAWMSEKAIGKADELQESVNKGKSLGMMERCFFSHNPTKPKYYFEKKQGLQKIQDLRVDMDAWIQGTMMKLTDSKDPVHLKMQEQYGGIPLEEISNSMWQELKLHRHIDPIFAEELVKPSYITIIEKNKLPYNPGLREKIRRAARRLIVFPLEKSEFALRFGADSEELHPIELSQNRGRDRLTSLKDVSYAKQEIYIRRKV